jgi:hypothetical protein
MSQQPTQNLPLPQRPIPNIGAILTRAAWHIERNGHCQGAFVAPIVADDEAQEMTAEQAASRPLCTVGAICLAAGGHPEEESLAARAAIRFLSCALPGEPPVDESTGLDDHVEHIAAWNDRAGRTSAEVVARLREVALLASGVPNPELPVAAAWIAEHGDYADWSPAEHAAYEADIRALHPVGAA